MGLKEKDKAYRANYRQKKIVELISQPGGVSCSRLARRFHVSRADIIQDIRDLRAAHYPIQTWMTTEDGMYGLAFEMISPSEMS